MELTKKQAALLKALTPLIQEYLQEVKDSVSVESYLKELAVVPIYFNSVLGGFWAVRIRVEGDRKLATVKAIYISNQYRGGTFEKVADEIFSKLEAQGVTDIEIWASARIQPWLSKRYKIEPTIFISHNPLAAFKIGFKPNGITVP